MGRMISPTRNGKRTYPNFVAIWLEVMLDAAAMRRNGMMRAADMTDERPVTWRKTTQFVRLGY